MIAAQLRETLSLLSPPNRRLTRRVGLELFALFLLLKWLEKQTPGRYLEPLPDELQWNRWIREREITRPGGLGRFVSSTLLDGLRKHAAKQPDTPLAALFSQDPLVVTTFGEHAHYALQVIDSLDLGRDEHWRACRDVFRAELDRLALAESAGGPSVPDAVCDMAIALLDVEAGAVLYDPACTTGTLLSRTAALLRELGRPPVRAHAHTTQDWALLCIVASILETGEPLDPRTLTNVKNVDQLGTTADFVVTNPPFGYGRDEAGRRTKADQVMPVRVESDFLERALRAMPDNGGKLAVILPDGLLSNRSRAAVALRTLLATEFQLRCVVSLPSGLFPGNRARTSLLCLEHTSAANAFVRYFQLPPGAANDPGHLRTCCRSVVALYRRPVSHELVETGEGVTAWAVPAQTIRGDEHKDLAPRRPQPEAATSEHEFPGQLIQRLLSSTRELEQSLRNLQRLCGSEGGESR